MVLRTNIHRSFWEVLCFACLSTAVNAADGPGKLEDFAVIDPLKVDADFAFQGEYHGQIWGDLLHCVGRNIALQVIARGGGEFEAKMFDGGFPGLGWDQMEPTRL